MPLARWGNLSGVFIVKSVPAMMVLPLLGSTLGMCRTGQAMVISSSGWFYLLVLVRWCHLPYEQTRRCPFLQTLRGVLCLHWSSGWLTLRVLVFSTLNAYSEFAVTALSEGSSVLVILTWSLQYTALSKGWHRTCSEGSIVKVILT